MSGRINFKEISDFLFSCGCCKYCVLRYLKPRFEEFANIDESLKKVKIFHCEFQLKNRNLTKLFLQRGISTPNDSDDSCEKKQKLNPCVICYGLFESIDELVDKIANDENIQKYQLIKKFISSFSLPVLLELTQLQMWLALLAKFPELFNKGLLNAHIFITKSQ